MEDVPEPRKRRVLVALVQEFDLLFDDVFSLRAAVFVVVHSKPRSLMAVFCYGRES